METTIHRAVHDDVTHHMYEGLSGIESLYWVFAFQEWLTLYTYLLSQWAMGVIELLVTLDDTQI